MPETDELAQTAERIEHLLERLVTVAESLVEQLRRIEARLESVERSQWGPN